MRLLGTRVTDEAVHKEGWTTANTGWIIMSHLLTGILFYAGLGWLLSLWLVPDRATRILRGHRRGTS